MSREPAIERELGTLEKSIWLLDQALPFNFTMHARVRGRLSEEVLLKALAAVQARHSLLRVRILRKGWTGAYFESGEVPEIPLRIADVPEDQWPDRAELELQTRLPIDRGPLARCVLLRHHDDLATILFTFNHAIGDGISGAYLIRDLIHAASQAGQGKEPSLPMFPDPVKEAMEEYFPPWAKGVGILIRANRIFLHLTGTMLKNGIPASPLRDRWVPPKRQRALIAAKEIKPDLVRALIKKSHRENTTLHGALAAAHLIALCQERGKLKPRLYVYEHAINMRDLIVPPAAEEMGLFVVAIITLNRAGPDSDFWRLARDMRASLVKYIDLGVPFYLPMVMKSYLNISGIAGFGALGAGIFNKFMEWSLRAHDTGMSNLGKIDIEASRSGLDLESLGLVANGGANAFVATLNETLTWNFVSMEPLHSRDYTRRVADRAVKILEEKCL